ncbi:MAG TPA: flavodoxin family protein [Methanolinea sp.]|nr:flavodoxin family protein [Methanolinea sp.]HQK56104.1 flavodoxin family protein [Methanolinea sp.]
MKKTLVILCSYHHHNTEKIAKVIAKVLDAPIQLPNEVNTEEIQEYGLIGFGSGIYHGQHHESLLSLAERLPQVSSGNVFLFSTAGVTGNAKIARDHSPLRTRLQSKGYTIVGEFGCKGFNTNSFLKYVGGMNKGRPNDQDLRQAEEFASGLKKKYMS